MTKITKKHFYLMGGFSNPKLFRKHNGHFGNITKPVN